MKSIRTKLALLLAFLLLVSNAYSAEPKEKKFKYNKNKYVIYTGYCLKKVPSGMGKLYVIRPGYSETDKWCHDVLLGNFDNDVVEDATLMLASGCMYKGKVRFDVSDEEVTYVLYGGKFVGEYEKEYDGDYHRKESYDFTVYDSLIIKRYISDDFGCSPKVIHSKKEIDFSAELDSKKELEYYKLPYKVLAAFAGDAKELTVTDECKLDISQRVTICPRYDEKTIQKYH